MTNLLEQINHPADDTTIAVPAFRILIWFKGGGDVPAHLEAARAMFEAFVSGHGAQCKIMRHHGRRQNGRARPFDAADVRTRLAVGADFGAIHINGAIDPRLKVHGLPHLRIDHTGTRMVAELAVPVAENNVRLADAVTEALQGSALFGGIMGYGFYSPEQLESTHSFFPVAHSRFRAALQIQHVMGTAQLLRSKAPLPLWQRHPNALGGLPDIGWRTIVGAVYRDRLEAAPQGLDVQEIGENLIVQAGDAPIWGNEAEDLAPYQNMAEFLKPVRVERELAYVYFKAVSTEQIAQADAYFDRFNR